jgi:hypothetical protein
MVLLQVFRGFEKVTASEKLAKCGQKIPVMCVIELKAIVTFSNIP